MYNAVYVEVFGVENTSVVKDVALLVIGAVAGLLPWLLDKVGIEMPKPVYVGLLLLSVALVWWALVSLGWLEKIPFLQGRSMSLSNTILSFAVAGILLIIWLHLSERKAPQVVDWDTYKKDSIVGKTFRQERVIVDGHTFSNCVFDKVTLVYNGTAPFDLLHNEFIVPIQITSDRRDILGAFTAMQEFNKMNAAFGKQQSKPTDKKD